MLKEDTSSRPSELLRSNFDIKQAFEDIEERLKRRVKNGLMEGRTAEVMRDILVSYLNGNTVSSFTTDKFIRITTTELIMRLRPVLLQDKVLSKDSMELDAFLISLIDSISLALKRALGGKERALMLQGVQIKEGIPVDDSGRPIM